MWLTNSSVGKKVVMSLTGLFLILFVTFHVLMNVVGIISPEGYNLVCEFLGANWYALLGTLILAAGAVIHIIYAFWLTFQNRKARGNNAYAVSHRPKNVEWASQNMLALGIVVIAFLIVHMMQFWAKMQLPEMLGEHLPMKGMGYIYTTFGGTCGYITLVIYLIGFTALWFHLTHGFWSAFQSLGTNNTIWLPRLKAIGCIWATVVCGLFAIEAIVFTAKANCPKCEATNAEYMYNCCTSTCVVEEDVVEVVELTPCASDVCEKSCGNACETPCTKENCAACPESKCAGECK